MRAETEVHQQVRIRVTLLPARDLAEEGEFSLLGVTAMADLIPSTLFSRIKRLIGFLDELCLAAGIVRIAGTADADGHCKGFFMELQRGSLNCFSPSLCSFARAFVVDTGQ